MIDLRDADEQTLSVLAYGWELYPQKLLAPGEFDGHQPIYLYLGQYGGFESGNSNASPHGCATYRLRILLPSNPAEYALELPEIYTTSRIWVNGQPVRSLGNVEKVESAPSIQTGYITFHAEKEAEIVVQAADHTHYYSGMVYPPAFGSLNAVSNLISFRFLRTCVMVISAFTIGIMYLLIGIRTGSGQRRMVLFAFTSIMFGIHVIYPLLHTFGAGYWSYTLEDVSFHLFLFLLTALHCSLCGIKGRPQKLVLLISGSTAALSLVIPRLVLNHSLDAMMVYSFCMDGYKLFLFSWLIVTALRNRESGDAMNGPLLAGLCLIATGLLFQAGLPLFEPVRYGWQTENAGFVFILLLAGGLWFDTVNAYAGQAALSENIRLMKNQFSLQEENYQIITKNFEQIRQMRHDLRHHLHTIQELAKEQQYEALEQYIDGCKEHTDQAARPTLCENQAVNAVLNYYQQLAVNKQITLELKVSLPVSMKMEGWNLGILYGNLIENAMEACEKLPEENRIIQVYSRISKGNLLLRVKNRWNGQFSSSGERIYSSKHDGLGIGLASVRSLVEKENGQFYLDPGEEMFEVSVIIWDQVT